MCSLLNGVLIFYWSWQADRQTYNKLVSLLDNLIFIDVIVGVNAEKCTCHFRLEEALFNSNNKQDRAQKKENKNCLLNLDASIVTLF